MLCIRCGHYHREVDRCCVLCVDTIMESRQVCIMCGHYHGEVDRCCVLCVDTIMGK